MAFSASSAAMEGFRIIRREPGTVAVWAGVQLVISVAVTALLLPVMGSAMAGMGVVPGAAPGASAAQLAAFSKLFWLYLLLTPFYLAVISIYSGAIYRAVLRPADKGFARLRLGGDELRLAGLWVLMGLFFFAVFLAVGMVVGAGGVAISLASKSSPGAWALGLVVIYLLLFGVCIWLGVRLSLAAPMTFDQKRIRLFSSWKLTKGRFWPLFGCYLLVWVFLFIIVLLDVVVSGAVLIGASGGSFSRAASGLFRPDYTSYANLFTPAYAIRLVLGAAFGAIIWTLTVSAPAEAYKTIVGATPEDQAETFA